METKRPWKEIIFDPIKVKISLNKEKNNKYCLAVYFPYLTGKSINQDSGPNFATYMLHSFEKILLSSLGFLLYNMKKGARREGRRR